MKVPNDDTLKALQSGVDQTVPRGWKVKVRRHPSGEGIHATVTQAPNDLLQDLMNHGIDITGCMHYPGTMHTYNHYMSPANRDVMQDLWAVLNQDNPPVGHHGHYYVALDIGTKADPFHHVLLDVLDQKAAKVKKLHPKVQAYADHAKAMGVLIQMQKAQQAEADRKRLFPKGSKHFIKQAKGNRSWA